MINIRKQNFAGSFGRTRTTGTTGTTGEWNRLLCRTIRLGSSSSLGDAITMNRHERWAWNQHDDLWWNIRNDDESRTLRRPEPNLVRGGVFCTPIPWPKYAPWNPIRYGFEHELWWSM